MFIRDYPEVQSTEENDVLLLDRLNGGTKTIKAKNMLNRRFVSVVVSRRDPSPISTKLQDLYDVWENLSIADRANTYLFRYVGAVGDTTGFPTTINPVVDVMKGTFITTVQGSSVGGDPRKAIDMEFINLIDQTYVGYYHTESGTVEINDYTSRTSGNDEYFEIKRLEY